MIEMRFILRIFLMAFTRFLHGESIKNINSACFVVYANYLDAKSRGDASIEYYNKALVLNDNNFFAYNGLAVALFKKINSNTL